MRLHTLQLTLGLALGTLTLWAAPTPTLCAAEWITLFDGHSTDAWRSYGKDTLSSGWKVQDGALVRAAGGAGDIITKEEFGDFELTLEYRISQGGNSGIMFGVQEIDGPPWHTGPEIQIQDNKNGHDPQLSGWLYQFYQADTDATKPAGAWNEVRFILQNHGKSEFWMNGVKYYEFEKGSQEWQDKLAKSKFAKMPKFAKFDQGHLCLQDHGNEVAYRNIKIKPLKTSD